MLDTPAELTSPVGDTCTLDRHGGADVTLQRYAQPD